MTPQATYKGLQGTLYPAGREIGRGGEGAVFEVKDNPALVLKLYTEALGRDKAEKLQYMCSIQDVELGKFAAWPLDVVHSPSGQNCGFVMKKLEGFVPLHMLFSPIDRKRLFPDKGYNFLIHVARNLATAFHKIHYLGIVMGDVNEANILVNANGMVALIDCDSFQVKNGDRYHFCEVGIPRYTPPELLERGSFNQVIRTVDTDSFSLATLIFQLLFLGRPPFTGINLSNEDIDEEKAIKTREFAYSLRRKRKKLNPARNSFELQNLTDELVDLFHQAFETTGTPRPAPRQWIAALDTLSKEMITCHHSKLHLYPRKMQQCPWCRFKEKAGIVYFLDDSYLRGIPELNDIDRFVNGFKLEKIELKKLSPQYIVNGLRPAPIGRRFRQLKVVNQAIFVIAILATITVFFVNTDINYSFVGILFLLMFWAASPFKRQLQQELTRRRNVFNTLKLHFETLISQHNNPADLVKYNQAAQKLHGLINDFKGLPAEFSARKKKVEEKHYNLQFQTFLQQFTIDEHQIPSFGPAKKQLLYKSGIITAADVSRLNSVKVAGIGPANIHILQAWQRQVGTAFAYVPDFNLINQDIIVAGRDIGIKKQKLEHDIKAEYKGLHYLRANILMSVTSLERQYDDLAKSLHQARLDLDAFHRLVK